MEMPLLDPSSVCVDGDRDRYESSKSRTPRGKTQGLTVKSDSLANLCCVLSDTGSREDIVRVARPVVSENRDFDVAEFLIVHKKSLNVPQHDCIEIADIGDLGVQERLPCCGDKAVVAVGLSVGFSLLGFDHADQGAFEEAARKSRLLDKDENIERIPVLGLRRRHEAKVKRKHHALWKDLRELKHPRVWIVLKFVSRALRRFNDDIHDLWRRTGVGFRGRIALLHAWSPQHSWPPGHSHAAVAEIARITGCASPILPLAFRFLLVVDDRK